MRFRRAILWSGVSQLGSSGITLLSTIILSRFLTPSDFGIIGIVTILIAFSQMMVDSEMGGALLRKRDVNRLDYSTLFYYNLVVSLVVYGIIFLSAEAISGFYDRPELINLIRIIGLTIIIHAFRVVQRIIVLRNLQYRAYAIINLTSGLLSLVVAILTAWLGYGYWSLVWQQVSGATFNVILLSIYTRFVPVFSFSTDSFKYQFSFGISLVGSDIIRTISNNITTNVIAKISSLQFTGYYTQTSRLSNFCQSTFGSIMDQTVFPILAKLHTRNEIRRMYYRILCFLCFCILVITIVFELFARHIIRIVLGFEWLSATWMFQLLCLAILPATIQVLCRNILKTLAETNTVMLLETIKSSVMILSIFIGLPFGDKAILIGLVISQFISAIIWLIFTHRETNKNIQLED